MLIASKNYHIGLLLLNTSLDFKHPIKLGETGDHGRNALQWFKLAFYFLYKPKIIDNNTVIV